MGLVPRTAVDISLAALISALISSQASAQGQLSNFEFRTDPSGEYLSEIYTYDVVSNSWDEETIPTPFTTRDRFESVSGESVSSELRFMNPSEVLSQGLLYEDMAGACPPLDNQCIENVMIQYNAHFQNHQEIVPVTLGTGEQLYIDVISPASTVSLSVGQNEVASSYLTSFQQPLDGSTLTYDTSRLAPVNSYGPLEPGYVVPVSSSQASPSAGETKSCWIFVIEGFGQAGDLTKWVGEVGKQTVEEIVASGGPMNVGGASVVRLQYNKLNRVDQNSFDPHRRNSTYATLGRAGAIMNVGDRAVFVGHSLGAIILLEGLGGLFQNYYSWYDITGVYTLDAPLGGGWLNFDKWWDYPTAAGYFSGQLGPISEEYGPVYLDLKAGSDVLNRANATTLPTEHRFNRMNGADYMDWRWKGIPNDTWDHDPFNPSLAGNRHNATIKAAIQAELRGSIMHCLGYVFPGDDDDDNDDPPNPPGGNPGGPSTQHPGGNQGPATPGQTGLAQSCTYDWQHNGAECASDSHCTAPEQCNPYTCSCDSPCVGSQQCGGFCEKEGESCDSASIRISIAGEPGVSVPICTCLDPEMFEGGSGLPSLEH